MSFLKKLKYAAETAKDVARGAASGEELTVSDEEGKRRMSICEGCPHFIKSLKACNECGCMMKLKTNLKHAKCPLGKW